ncbi:MAG: hypothetical protein HY226_00345 [Candidatus Vogelbacteria bacterium]|nr:hypothetical protein [Candidatus Vogelbacteria bacterium]
MENLNARVAEVYVVYDSDFDGLVGEIVGREVSFREITEGSSGTDHFYSNVRSEPDFGGYKPETTREQIQGWFNSSTEQAQNWIDGKSSSVGIPYVLQWLCVHGHIKPGNYLIRVS